MNYLKGHIAKELTLPPLFICRYLSVMELEMKLAYMFNKVLIASLLLLTITLGAQTSSESKKGLKRIYTGLAIGSDFNRFHGGMQLSSMFYNSWGASLDFMQGSRIARNLPSDYRGDVTISAIGRDSPSDYLQTYSLLLSREISLSRNFGLSLRGGPGYSVQRITHFDPVADGLFKSNYRQYFSNHETFGITTRVGIYWIAARWCGFDLHLTGNFNGIRSYAAINLGINLGWMGKEF